ncbi:MAG: LytR/AlgR family response regulator transcription factor [bacterium]
MKKPYYLVETESKMQKIFLSDILYIGIVNDRTTFQLTEGKKYTEKTLKEIESLFPNYFFRISRYYIINIFYISEFIKKDKIIILSNGDKLIVSQRRASKICQFLRKMSIIENV